MKGDVSKFVPPPVAEYLKKNYKERYRIMTQLRIKELLGKANFLLENGLHILAGFVVIRSAEMEALLDRIDASIPEDIKEAELILRRRDEIFTEAQNRQKEL